MHRLLFLLMLSVMGSDLHAASDPMDWSPPKERPKLVERVSQKEFAGRRANALERLKHLAELEKDMPARGSRIDFIFENSQAAALGVELGDILLRLDGEPITDSSQFISLRKPGPQKVDLWSVKTRQEKTIEIKPGRFGTSMNPFQNAGKWTYMLTPPDPRWEENIRLAAFLSKRDGELAETCLFHALKSGCPQNAEIDELAATVLYDSWRYADAMNYAWFAMQPNPKASRFRATFFLSAWLTNKYDAALGVAKGDAEFFPQFCEAMRIARTTHLALPAEKRSVASPLERAKTLYQDCLVLRSVIFPSQELKPDKFGPWREEKMREIFFNDRLVFNLERDKGQVISFGPGVKNLLLTFNFAVSPHDTKVGKYLTHFVAGVFDITKPGIETFGIEEILGITCTSSTFNIRPFDSNLVVNESHEKLFDDREANKAHTFKLAVWEGRVEVELDGRTIFVGPSGQKNAQLGVMLRSVGMDIEVWRLEAYELLDEPEKSALLKKDINTAYRHGYTRIHRAAEKWDLPSTKDLLNFHPDLTLRTEYGEQPLHCAARVGTPGVADAMISSGAKLDLLAAAAMGRKAALKELLAAKPNVNETPCQWTALHGAVVSNDPETITMLLDAGADINARTKRWGERTPLMWAAYYKRKEAAATTLLARGVDVNVGDARKNTALWYAEQMRNEPVRILLQGKNTPRTEAVRPPGPPPGDF